MGFMSLCKTPESSLAPPTLWRCAGPAAWGMTLSRSGWHPDTDVHPLQQCAIHFCCWYDTQLMVFCPSGLKREDSGQPQKLSKVTNHFSPIAPERSATMPTPHTQPSEPTLGS